MSANVIKIMKARPVTVLRPNDNLKAGMPCGTGTFLLTRACTSADHDLSRAESPSCAVWQSRRPRRKPNESLSSKYMLKVSATSKDTFHLFTILEMSDTCSPVRDADLQLPKRNFCSYATSLISFDRPSDHWASGRPTDFLTVIGFTIDSMAFVDSAGLVAPLCYSRLHTT